MNLKNKTKITTIALISILAMSAVLFTLPITIAQDEPGTWQTYPFLGAIPNPVGKGQTVLFHVGIFQQLLSAQMGWEDISIIIEKPDGTTDTIDGIRTDSTGGTGKTYTPDQVGIYLCKTHFPAQEITATKRAPGGARGAPPLPIGTVMLESESAVLELEVLEDPITYYPDNPLPSEYWTRPIDAQLRSWQRIAGNWLAASNEFPSAVPGNEEAPETAHILWTKELTQGGLAGATDTRVPYWAFSHGDAYEGKWQDRLIINGILIYDHRSNDEPYYYTAVDVRTGEELWKKVIEEGSIAFGQNMVWEGYNHHAVYPYFWVTSGSTWYSYDPYTGEMEFTVENVPSGTTLTDENGWLYRVGLNFTSGEGYIWSLTDLVEPFGEDSPAPGSWLPAGSFYGRRHATYDAAAVNETTQIPLEATTRAYLSEFTFAADHCPGGSGVIRGMALGDKIFGLQYSSSEIKTWAISLEEGHEGTLLYSETWTAPAEWVNGNFEIEFNALSLEDSAAVIWTKDTLEYYCFSTDTGKLVWGPAEPEYYMNYYGWTEFLERPPFIWDGKLYSTGAGGHIYCYDITNGDVIWDYIADDPYQEYLFANEWWQFFLFIADGKLYSAHLEHSAIEPMPRGAPFLCLDAQNGDLIWRADGLFRSTRWGGRGIIGDSVMVSFDTYDNRIYGVGKGASAITVECPQDATTDSGVTLKGTVMDVSPGCLSDTNIQIRFPKGVPAVADACMSEWMLYVWKQFARPMDITGVPVKLEAVTPGGTLEYIGTTTSDAYGNYGFGWYPDQVGLYMIIATFEGSGAYYGATETTYLEVSEPMIVDCPDPCPDMPDDIGERLDTQTMYILILIVLVIIAIIIAIYCLMKCRK